MKKKGKSAPTHTHVFDFRVPDRAGVKPRSFKIRAKVKFATRPTSIELTERHIAQALKQDGMGNAAACAGSVCLLEHANAFNHNVEPYVHWLYTRVFITDKLDGDGVPKSCVEYVHYDQVARLFDTRAGLKKLQKRISEKGPITIHLYPVEKQTHYKTGEKSHPSGSPSPGGRRDTPMPKGAALRLQINRLDEGLAA